MESFGTRKDSEDCRDRLVPFIKAVLIGLCIAFIVSSSIQLFMINKQIFEFEEYKINPVMERLYSQSPSEGKLRWWAVSELEVYAINQRYHQAHVLLMSRIWIQYLSFFMGIIMITIGAVFVFGKVRDLESSIDVENKWFGRLLFRSTSPGLFVTLFGVLLIIFSFAYQRNIEVVDRSVYLNSYNLMGQPGEFTIAPPDSSIIHGVMPQLDTTATPPPKPTGQ